MVRYSFKLTTMPLTEEDLKELQELVFEQKIRELFEEPCTYEDENDDN